MVASSFRPPVRGDSTDQKSHSQSTETAFSGVLTPVSKLLERKGTDVFSVTPDQTIHDAVNLLRDKRIGAVPVVDESGRLVGILSERDIVRKMADMPGQTLPSRVGDTMTTTVSTCKPSDTIVEVLKLMTEKRFRHMPVMEGDHIRGIVTIGDVVHYRMAELEHEALRMKQLIVG